MDSNLNRGASRGDLIDSTLIQERAKRASRGAPIDSNFNLSFARGVQ